MAKCPPLKEGGTARSGVQISRWFNQKWGTTDQWKRGTTSRLYALLDEAAAVDAFCPRSAIKMEKQ